jgi:hypothetical protein
MFPTERTNYFDVSKIMNCTWARSNKRIMTHLKIRSQFFFHRQNGNLNDGDKKSTQIFLNELNKRREISSVTQNYMPREIWDISYENATLN